MCVSSCYCFRPNDVIYKWISFVSRCCGSYSKSCGCVCLIYRSIFYRPNKCINLRTVKFSWTMIPLKEPNSRLDEKTSRGNEKKARKCMAGSEKRGRTKGTDWNTVRRISIAQLYPYGITISLFGLFTQFTIQSGWYRLHSPLNKVQRTIQLQTHSTVASNYRFLLQKISILLSFKNRFSFLTLHDHPLTPAQTMYLLHTNALTM